MMIDLQFFMRLRQRRVMVNECMYILKFYGLALYSNGKRVWWVLLERCSNSIQNNTYHEDLSGSLSNNSSSLGTYTFYWTQLFQGNQSPLIQIIVFYHSAETLIVMRAHYWDVNSRPHNTSTAVNNWPTVRGVINDCQTWAIVPRGDGAGRVCNIV